MADDAPSGKHHGMSKFLSRERWRSKSSAGDDPPPKQFQLNDDVVDFLRPSASTSKARPLSPNAPKAPRIDVAAAQRWTGNSPELRSGNNIAPMLTPSSLKKPSNPRRQMRKNLKVEFSAVSEVIGEGGDECEDPTMEISRRRRAMAEQRHSRGFDGRTPTLPNVAPPISQPSRSSDELHPGFGTGTQRVRDHSAAYRALEGGGPPPRTSMENDFVPNPLKRTATGFGNHLRDSGSSVYSDDELSAGPSPATSKRAPTSEPNSFQLPQFNSVLDDSPLELDLAPDGSSLLFHDKRRESSLSNLQLQSKIHRMREEEGRALHQNARKQVTDLAEEVAPRTSTSTTDSYKAYSPVDGPQNNLLSAKSSVRGPPPPSSGAIYQQASQQLASKSSPVNKAPTPDVHGALPIRKPAPSPLNAIPPGAPVSQANSNRPSPQPLSIPPPKDISRQDPPTSNAQNFRPEALSRQQSEHRFTPSTATSMKPPPSAITQVAYEDFSERCSHMRGIFRLQAEFDRPIAEYTPTQFLRAAAWWFLKGRMGMETIIRSRPRSADGPRQAQEQLLQQPHVDLAKSWWILAEVLSEHPSLPPSTEKSFSLRSATARQVGDQINAEFFESAEILQGALRALLGSMSRNSVMPPSHALIQGQDQTIWIKYPKFASDLLPILTGSKSKSLIEGAAIRVFDPLSVMAVADTAYDFSYYRWFVTAHLGSEDQQERISMPCLFSVMRTRNDWHPKIALSTQQELVTVVVQGDRKMGPCWDDVKWFEAEAAVQVRLQHGYYLYVELGEQDYRILAALYKNAYSVQTSLFPHPDEYVAFEVPLRDFQYSDSVRPPAFPMERMRRCRVRVFVKTEVRKEGTGPRHFFRGMRFLVVTSPKNRTLASVSHDIGARAPMLLESMSDNATGDKAPALALHINEGRRQATLFMVFNEAQDRTMLHSALNQMELAPQETKFASVKLMRHSIETTNDAEAHARGAQDVLGKFEWQSLEVLNKDPENPNHDIGQTVLSDHLRIIARGVGITVTDRINVGPGELRLRLAANGTPAICFLRQPQDDLSLSVDVRAGPQPFRPEYLGDQHRLLRSQPTKRTFAFTTPADLHTFQLATTGFAVMFDGVAASFTISRRRPVTALSKHKRLEAGPTRVQIVAHEHERVVQLLAFFDTDDFPADALGFVLKSVDVFERFDAKGHSHFSSHAARFGVRLVDAKFALPRTEKGRASALPWEEVERRFVCLDMPEYPGENDDVWIGFEDEGERERFLKALPAPVTQMSRGITLKRKP